MALYSSDEDEDEEDEFIAMKNNSVKEEALKTRELDDSDNDDMEFEDAQEEEQLDILESNIRRSGAKSGKKLGYREIAEIAQKRVSEVGSYSIMQRVTYANPAKEPRAAYNNELAKL